MREAKNCFKEFCIKNNLDLNTKFEAFQFGEKPDLLLDLVISGKKTATSSLYKIYEFENEEVPKENDYSIILDSLNRPKAVIRNTNVRLIPYIEVTSDLAYLEGEDDLSLESWRKVHFNFFEQELKDYNLSFNPDMLIVFEEFEVLWVIPDKVTFKNINYEIIKLLGHGKGGYSYLVSDGINYYTFKQIHHEPCSYYNFGNKIEAELNDYNRLTSIGIRLPKMIDIDLEKEQILKEYIDGDTIFDLVLENKMDDKYIEQMKDMCKSLYANNTNIDYFPTNFIVNKDMLYYVDYECNNYMEEWNFENWGIKYWSKTKEFIEYITK